MIGKIFDDRYEVLEQIDEGGTAIIYRGVDRKTKNIVAIKVLKESLSYDKEHVKRFENEVAAALSLEHNNIVHVIDAGHTMDRYYLVMELIDGRTLKDIIISEGVIEINRAIDITIAVCNALNHAHMAGFVHRDIKPQNIMIDKNDVVKITDFGIARKMISQEKTEEKKIMGSVQYISPEQLKGEKIDKRSDIYSLGIMLFEMVTGKLPYEGENYQEVVVKHLNYPMPNPNEYNQNINNALNKIILKMTRKSKRYRQSNALEIIDQLKKCFEKPNGEYVRLARERPTVSKEDFRRARKKMVFNILLLSSFVLVTVGLLIALVTFGKRANEDVTILDRTSVPNFIGLSESDVIEIANESSVSIDRQYDFSKEVNEGLVISQDPQEGEQIIYNGNVTVVFSQGVQSINIPSVLNQHIDEAINVLTGQSLLVGTIEYIESDQPDGYVISQEPEADSLMPIDEEITLIVSKDKTAINSVVPDLLGLTIEQVKIKMDEMEFDKCFVYLEEREEGLMQFDEITVLDQSPPADSDENIANPIFVWTDAYIDNFQINKVVETIIDQPDTLVRVTIKGENSLVEYVMAEIKLDKGEQYLDVTLKSFEAKEDIMNVYVNDELVYEEVLTSWGRKE